MLPIFSQPAAVRDTGIPSWEFIHWTPIPGSKAIIVHHRLCTRIAWEQDTVGITVIDNKCHILEPSKMATNHVLDILIRTFSGMWIIIIAT